MATVASGYTARTATVKYNQSDSQHYKSGEYEMETFYDYGTWMPFDNARIYGETSTTTSDGYVYAGLKYADYGVKNFKTKKESSYGSTAYTNYNPGGVDYLQPDSYANTYTNGMEFYLRVIE